MSPDAILRLIVLPLGVALAMLSASSSATATSAEGCSGGEIPFKILDDADESGIGGTGIATELHADADSTLPTRPTRDVRGDGSESGIGGTGRSPGSTGDDESGIGGTGIFGTVTRLDRLCVNGLEITLPPNVSIETATASTSEARQDLEVGMVVFVEATPTDEGLVAERVQIAPTLAGRIDVLYDDGRAFIVSGQRVRLPEAVSRSLGAETTALRPGQWVIVHGLRDPAGQWIASRIERHEEDEILRERELQLETGGSPDASDAIATWLAEHPRPGFVSVEGYVERSRDDRDAPRILGLSLEFGPGSAPESRGRLRSGVRIRATGRLTEEHSLRVEPLPRMGRPERLESSEHRVPPTRDETAAPPRAEQPKPPDRPPRPSRAEEPDRSWNEVPKRPERPPRRTRPERRPPRPPIDRRGR